MSTLTQPDRPGTSPIPSEAPETVKTRAPRIRHFPWHWPLLLLAAAGFVYWYTRPPAPPTQGGPAALGGRRGDRNAVVPVVASTVRQTDVPIYLEGLGTVQPLNNVTIRSRVDGQLLQIAFTEGQIVRVGEVLAKIDPAPFQAAFDQACAKKRQDEALLANARLDLVRYEEMLARKATSQQQYDTQKNLVTQYEATVAGDEATIESARVQLGYATLVSPLEGRIGIRQVDQGNIIHASDANGLVTVTQLNPITVLFTVPAAHLPEIRRQMEKGELEVQAVDGEDGPVLSKGTVTLFDNQIDSTTGTIRLKATFSNETFALWPGQFVTARLLLSTRKNGVVVPAAVIQRGPEGAFVFVIQKGKSGGKREGGSSEAAGDKKTSAHAKSDPQKTASEKPSKPEGAEETLSVEVRPVKIAQIEAGQALIDEGLTPGEQVVLEGQYRLQARSRVRLMESAVKKAEKPEDKPQNPSNDAKKPSQAPAL